MFNSQTNTKVAPDEVESDTGMTAFNEYVTVQKKSQHVWKSSQPLSVLRDRWVGDVQRISGEYRVRTTDEAPFTYLSTVFRGDYVPGFEFEWGIGVRVPHYPTEDGEIRVGYFDSGDGFYVEIAESGLSLVWKTDGTLQEVVSQDQWNQDVLNGSNSDNNPSGAHLDLTTGVIVQGRMVYYGYGFLAIYFGVRDTQGHFRMIEAHVFGKREGVSLNTSNLFLNLEIDKGSGTDLEAFVGGRQMSTLGDENNQFRVTGEYRTRTDITDEWTPLVSVRSKQVFFEVFTRLFSVEAASEANLLLGIFLDPELDQTRFIESGVSQDKETAVLYDTSADTMNIEDSFVFSGMTLVPGQRSTNNSHLLQDQLSPKRLPEDSIVTVAAKRVDSSAPATGTVRVNIEEGW